VIYAAFWFLVAGIVVMNLGTLSGLPPELRKAVLDRLAAQSDLEE
jgi:TRAP-type C4-dicarboxylate transport system substrate-binding protein